MHILVCDDDAAFSAKVAEYAATYFEAHEIPVQATVCSDPEQVLAIPDLELYRIAFLDVDMPQVNGIALGGQLRHRVLQQGAVRAVGQHAGHRHAVLPAVVYARSNSSKRGMMLPS